MYAITCLEEYQKAHVEEAIAKLKEKGDFPAIPLVLVTHSSELAIQENMLFGNNTREFAKKVEDMWQQIMKEYLTFSPQSEWLEADKSTHYIHLTQPELVLQAVEKIKGQQA